MSAALQDKVNRIAPHGVAAQDESPVTRAERKRVSDFCSHHLAIKGERVSPLGRRVRISFNCGDRSDRLRTSWASQP